MESFENARIKWPYVTHLLDRRRVVGLLPPVEESNPGGLVLARVLAIGKHKDLETVHGRKLTLFPGDVFVGALGNRYATDQFEARAYCSGTDGHIVGIGGVCGEVVSKNSKMPEPTRIEWLGRLAGSDGAPLNLRDFRIAPPRRHDSRRPTTILSVGASMNSGKTTTAAYIVRALSTEGYRVGAAKLTGTACRKDPGVIEDAGATRVLDFTHYGFPSTAGCSLEELLSIARDARGTLLEDDPHFIVYEIADGIFQRETRMMLHDQRFRESVDAVTFAAPDSLSCECGARLLRSMGYRVAALSGLVSASPLGIAEVEAATGLPCLSVERILDGGFLAALELARAA